MIRRSISSLAALALAVGHGFAQGDTPAKPSVAKPSVAEQIAAEVREVFQRAQPAVVKITGADSHGPLAGTGFCIDPNGTIITSHTVGGEASNLIVWHQDVPYPAERLVADARSGVAVLKIKTRTPFLLPGKLAALEIASPVVLAGFPMDLPAAPSFGTVGGFDMKYQGRWFATAHIRANAPVQRGQSGSPMLNMRGEVVGVCLSMMDGGAGCFALPIDAVEKVRRDFAQFGEPRPVWLGVTVGPSEQRFGGSTAEIREVQDESPGHLAKLETGDVLIHLGQRRITTPEDLLDATFFLTAGESVAVRVMREGEIVETTLRPGFKSDLGKHASPGAPSLLGGGK